MFNIHTKKEIAVSPIHKQKQSQIQNNNMLNYIEKYMERKNNDYPCKCPDN